MKARHQSVQGKISKQFILLSIILSAVLLVLLPFLIRPFVFADVNEASNDLVDPNYATKEYWDKEYGIDRTYIDQSFFTPGMTITEGDYFIKTDIVVNGVMSTGDTDKPGAGISISGDVRFFLERPAAGQPGPTLTFKGGDSCNANGAAPGIELTQGNSLTFQGVGIVNANGGLWNNSPSSSYPKAGGKGGDASKGAYVVVPWYKSGGGGDGSEGLGGAGAAIGSFGGKGGSGAKGPSGKEDFAGTGESDGDDGHSGGDGGNTLNSGILIAIGNVVINAKSGYIIAPTFKAAGNCGDVEYFGTSLADSNAGAGGGGGIGGAGWAGAAIGSGGAGGGGGGAGGGGGTCFWRAKHHWGYENIFLNGGGGGNGASGFYHELLGGGVNLFGDDVSLKALEGRPIGQSTDLNNNQSDGGRGSYQDFDDPYGYAGHGGSGGKGGISGNGGYFYSALINSIATNASANRATGTSSTYLRRFVENLCKITFKGSLVNWCAAYRTDEKDPVTPANYVYNFPSGTILTDDNHDRTKVKYEDNIKAGGWATVTHTGLNTPDEGYVLTTDKNFEIPGSVSGEFYLVKKGAVEVGFSVDNVEYSGHPITIDPSELKVTFEGQDVTSELKSYDIQPKFYIVEGDKLIELDDAPKDVGNYKVEVYIFSDDYIGKSEMLDFEITKKDATIHALTAFHNTGEPEPDLKASVHGVVQGEVLTKDVDYTLTKEPIEDWDNVWLIKVDIIDSSPLIGNYNITTKNGYYFERNPEANAKLSVVNSEEGEDLSTEYGSGLPEIKVKAEGFDDSDTPVEGRDYEVVYDEHAKDAGEYPVYIVLLPTDITLYYNIELVSNNIVINKKDATLSVVDNNKTYGDSDPIFNVNVDGLVYGETFSEGATADYTINRYNGNPSEDAGEHQVKALINENGPVSKNYSVTAEEGKLTINKRDAKVWAEDIINGYTLPEKPLVLNQGSDLVWGEKLVKGEDFTIDRTRGTGDPEPKGEYTITPTIINNGPIAKNYNITAANGTYIIKGKTAKISADNKTSVYGEDDVELTVTAEGLEQGDVLQKDKDYKISREQGKDVGTYTINIDIIEDGPVSTNYYFQTITPGTYTITQKTATLIADDKVQEYGENQVALTVSSQDYVYDDKLVEGEDYTISRSDSENHNVGEYVISAVVIAEGPVAKNYNFTTQNGTYTITKAKAEIIPLGGGWNWKYYGDTDPAFKADVNDLKYDDELKINVDYILYRDDGENTGGHEVKAKVIDTSITNNYDIDVSRTGDFTIREFKHFDEVDIESLKEPLVYKGEPLCPDFNVTYDFGRINEYERNGSQVKKFEKDVDYQIEYINNDKPGTATAIITGINGCYGTTEMTFDIINDPNASDPELVDAAQTYDEVGNIVIMLSVISVVFGLVLIMLRKREE